MHFFYIGRNLPEKMFLFSFKIPIKKELDISAKPRLGFVYDCNMLINKSIYPDSGVPATQHQRE